MLHNTARHHHLASQSALAVMRGGGNPIEAMIAAAATIATAYPHMNGIVGYAFWLVLAPGGTLVAIDACGPAARAATIDAYRQRGHAQIPLRGPLSANTVAGTIGGWQVALDIAAEMGSRMPLTRLLEDAIGYAIDGVAATLSQQNATAAKLAELRDQPGFSAQFLIDGALPRAGQRFRQTRLAHLGGISRRRPRQLLSRCAGRTHRRRPGGLPRQTHHAFALGAFCRRPVQHDAVHPGCSFAGDPGPAGPGRLARCYCR